HRAGGVDAQLDRVGRSAWLRRGVERLLRRAHVDRDRLDRHGPREDEPQHQHHVHEGRDGDVAHCAAGAGRKCHGGTPYWPRLGGVVTKPTLRMPWAWAIFTTSLTMRYGVVRSPRMLTVGCGVFCASADSLLSISWRVAGSS